MKILVVDDHHDSVDSLSRLLEAHGHETARAYDGRQALDVFRQFEPAVVVLDIDMPVLDGYGTARAVRLTPSHRLPVLVALTGLTGHETRRLAFDAGFDAHVNKPARIEALLELMDKLLRERS
ncbi:response regulator [Scleromatobacter humisilvae]|uniref:Response regulator n=1 Tax=Scleromatobacter humisilvae TaxID=2897159 RepID=A0A9X1YG28_9BURK|nr:response regulator [Scleromatobacter humisilvae]MCK9685047.1 response regulator [Scleromatobacter humisilvae]